MGSYSTTSTHPLIYKMKSSVFAIGLLLLATANASPPFLKAEETCETLKCCEITTTKAPTTTTGGSTTSGGSTTTGSTTTGASTESTTTTTTTTTTAKSTNKPKSATDAPTPTTTVSTPAPTCETLNCECNGVDKIFSCVGILLVAFLVNVML